MSITATLYGNVERMKQAAALVRLIPSFHRVEGLSVRGNMLTGTLCVDFDGEAGVTYDKDRILMIMRRVNRRMSNGYGIILNIREKSFLEGIYTSYGSVKVYVLRTLVGTSCEPAAACYDPNWNTIRITADAPDIYIVHELLHKLGLGHSGSPRSLMFWNQAARPSRDIKTFPEEIKALVDAYR